MGNISHLQSEAKEVSSIEREKNWDEERSLKLWQNIEHV